jgi:uncharacterized protein (TIGR02118 family)
MFHVVFEIHSLPELTHEEFAARYRRHGPLVRRLPGVRRYTQCLVTGSANSLGPAADSISILEFDCEDDYRKADSSPEMQAAHEDAASFVSHVVAYRVEAHEVPESIIDEQQEVRSDG